MTTLDPRVQLAWLTVVLAGILLGGQAGLAAGFIAGAVGVVGTGSGRGWLRLLWVLVPLLGLLVLLDLLAGSPLRGALTATRLLALATVGYAFTHLADGENLVAGLSALRLPYAITFVLVAGARFVPSTLADLTALRDAARLRGLVLDGPPWKQIRGWSVLLVPLVVWTIRRGLHLGEAMEARAFDASGPRTIRRQLAWTRRDAVAALAAAGYLAGVACLGLALG